MAVYDTVYLNHDNEIAYILLENGTSVDLTAAMVTSITIRVGNVLITGSTSATSLIRWGLSSYATGEVRLKFGSATFLTPGQYTCPITVYDLIATRGIVFGDIFLDVQANVEAT